jgi:sugar (pentulose or hexulose) kinase
MSLSPQVHVGVDLGTSGLKAVALADSGEVLGDASYRYPTARPGPGAAEQDPSDWLTAVRRALADLEAEVPASSWQAIGLTGMIPTLVLTDAAGDPVAPAVTWQDARATGQGRRWLEAAGDRYASTGQRVDGRYLLPMLLRLAEDDPAAFARSAWLLGAKDHIYWWLTGIRATDPSTATGMGCLALDDLAFEQQPLVRAAELLGADLPALPEIRPSTFAAPLSPARAAELSLPPGLPVVLGAADSVCGAAAFGIDRTPGAAAYLAGTSTVILGTASTPSRDSARRFLVTPMVTADAWGLEMDLLATGAALQWLGGLLGRRPDEVVRDADGADPLRAPVVLPYLAPGEQGALWHDGARGALVGLDLGHSAADLGRGLLTGIVVESRRCLEVLAEATGRRGPVHLGGGGASATLARDLADASARTVVRHHAGDPSALGAALTARTATAPAEDTGQTGPGATLEVTEPRPERAALWRELVDRHEDARLRLYP